MGRQYQLELLGAHLHQRHPQQRRHLHVEVAAQVLCEESLEGPVPPGLRRNLRAQVHFAIGQFHPVDDHLDRLPVGARHERGPEVGVPVEQRLACRPHPLARHRPAQPEDELHLVGRV
ncbi:hypothetical protein GCM10010277_06330 [Streptomyces longisporoflavus]|nr:hypothetical protein GCM10010277_06330 [Streptomyces longisporoflavus]